MTKTLAPWFRCHLDNLLGKAPGLILIELLGGRTSDSDRGCGNNYFCIVFKAGFPSFDSDKVNYKMSQID